MHPSVTSGKTKPNNWVYASLTVRDGDRFLRPTHVASDRILFAEPPRLISQQIEIVLANGDVQERHMAVVAPHAADATSIPIRLMPRQ
jgi:hypothetical protein